MSEKHLTETRFDSFNFADPIMQGIMDAGFTYCTPIQELTIPILLEGKDVAGQAQTGTGKTAAFMLGTLQYLHDHPADEHRRPNQPRAIILAPTRELAIQIHKDAELLSKHTGLKLRVVYGGSGYEQQRKSLEEVDILIGTQMLAKGHHFPRVTLVGVLDADGGLFSADFRAAERMAQLLVQVAGRAGRGHRPGDVLIQTRYPDNPLLQTLVRRGYAAFARQALQEREAAAMPPYSHQALLRADATRLDAAQDFLDAVAAHARQLAMAGVELWGPVPAPMTRRAGRHRVHLLLQAAQREPLHRVLSDLVEVAGALPQARRVRWSLDVDPVDLY